MKQMYSTMPKNSIEWADRLRRLTSVIIAAVIVSIMAFLCKQLGELYHRQSEKAVWTYHAEITDGVFSVVTHYTKVCDNFSANSDITLYDQNPGNAAAAVRLQRHLAQMVNISGFTSDQMTVYFPKSACAITSSQIHNAVGESFFTLRYGDILSQAVLEAIPANETWKTICGGSSCWLIRKAYNTDTGEIAAYIILKLELEQIVPNVLDGMLTIIGDDQMCIYSNGEGISEEEYGGIVASTISDRHFVYKRERYTATKCEFSAVNLNILVGIPERCLISATVRTGALIVLIVLCLTAAVIFWRRYLQRRGSQAKAAEPNVEEENVVENLRFLVPLGIGELMKKMSSLPEAEARGIADQVMTIIGLKKNEPFFASGLFMMDDHQGFFKSVYRTKVENKYKWNTFYWMLDNILGDVLFDKRVGAIAVIGNFFIVIAQCNENEDAERIQEIMDHVRKIYETNFQVILDNASPMIGCGSDDFIRITRRQMEELSSKNFWRGEETGEKLTDSNFKSYLTALQSAFDKINRLDYAGALDIIRRIMDEELPIGTANLHIAQRRAGILAEMLMASVGGQATERICPHLEERLNKIDNMAELREVVEKILLELILTKEEAKDTPTARRVEKIKAYVQEHINENSLNVTTIAEQFNISPSYLTKVFKENTGSSMLEYIQELRISKAKELLVNLPVKEVAVAVGFWDAQSFIRTFKKFEGMTPGEYKQSLRDESTGERG